MMRIQDTDAILKESRHARHEVAVHAPHGFFARLWSRVTSLFHHK
jgi:hypothetical protein